MNSKPLEPKRPRPVESFGPELFAALLAASTKEVRIPMTYRQGVRFRQRIHQMREAMRLSRHPKYETCTRVRIGIELPSDCVTMKSGRHRVPTDRGIMVTVVLSPNDSEFSDILSKAGVQLPSEIESETSPVLDREYDLSTLESMFGDIKKEPGDGS